MIPDVTLTPNFIVNPAELFRFLETEINWDSRIQARKTASFGLAYNYSQIVYPDREMLPSIAAIAVQISEQLGFMPNNCLVNYYADGRSKMGFHADGVSNLEEGCGIGIVSLGAVRPLRFRNILDQKQRHDYLLTSGSFLYMTQEVQALWKHAVPKADTDLPRISLTFRRLITKLN